jgi:hypothetical protein
MRLFAWAAGVVFVMGLSLSGAAQDQPLKGTLMDACVKSGYSLVTPDKKVLKFDAKGNDMGSALNSLNHPTGVPLRGVGATGSWDRLSN